MCIRDSAGVVLVHSVHGLMYSVWICVAAFSAIDPLLARASRNLGAGPVYTFWHIVLPQAAPGIVAASIFEMCIRDRAHSRQ